MMIHGVSWSGFSFSFSLSGKLKLIMISCLSCAQVCSPDSGSSKDLLCIMIQSSTAGCVGEATDGGGIFSFLAYEGLQRNKPDFPQEILRTISRELTTLQWYSSCYLIS